MSLGSRKQQCPRLESARTTDSGEPTAALHTSLSPRDPHTSQLRAGRSRNSSRLSEGVTALPETQLLTFHSIHELCKNSELGQPCEMCRNADSPDAGLKHRLRGPCCGGGCRKQRVSIRLC